MDNYSTQMMLGRYHLLHLLGKGGMGEVWLAEDPLLRRRVAIKQLLQSYQNDDEYLVRFEREARAAAALHHPHILPLHDYGQQRLPNGQLVTYIVMSYVSGGSVEEYLTKVESRKSLLPPAQIIAYLTQAASAIDYAHEQGVLHRDIKPANMLLRDDGTLLLTDFGLARLASDSGDLTHKSMVLGTPKYMAPEQAMGNAIAASDIYSLAIIAYRLFTGQPPFHADTAYSMIAQHMMAPPPPPRQLNPALSATVEEALLSGLAKDPAQRPPSATAFVNKLRQAMTVPLVSGHLTDSISTRLNLQPPASAPTTSTRSSRRKLLIGAGTAAVAVGGGLVALLFSPLWQTIFPAPIAPNKPQATSPTRTTANDTTPTIQIKAALAEPALQLAWSPVANTLAAIGQDYQVLLWNIQPGQTGTPTPLARHSFQGTNSDTSFAWSPGGDMLAIDNIEYGAELQVYKSDLSGPSPGFVPGKLTFPDNTGWHAICWAPERYLFLLREDASVQPSRSALRIYHPGQPRSPFLPLAINIQKGSTASTNQTMPMVFAPNGATLAIGGAVDDVTQGVLVGKVAITGTAARWQPSPFLRTDWLPTDLAWSPDGHYLAAAVPSEYSHVLHVWDTTHQYQDLKIDLNQTNIVGKPTAVAWSPNAKNALLATGTAKGEVHLWNIPGSSSPVRSLSAITNTNVTALAWSHDGQWLAASFNDSLTSILVWKIGDTHA